MLAPSNKHAIAEHALLVEQRKHAIAVKEHLQSRDAHKKAVASATQVIKSTKPAPDGAKTGVPREIIEAKKEEYAAKRERDAKNMELIKTRRNVKKTQRDVALANAHKELMDHLGNPRLGQKVTFRSKSGTLYTGQFLGVDLEGGFIYIQEKGHTDRSPLRSARIVERVN